MARSRRLATLLSAAALVVPAGAFAQGTAGAGDDQYEDPFAGSGTTTDQTPGSQTSSGGGSTLTQDPDLGGESSGTTSGTTGTTGSTGSTGTAAGTLPNTGSDPRLIILAGLALLLSGLGLRLRTADEIF